MATQAYIEDGYNEDGFIKESPGIHEAVRFKFRPVLPNRARSILDGWGKLDEDAKGDRIYTLIKEHVIEWNLSHKGKVLPIETDVLARLKQPVVDRIFNIITYSDKSDEQTKDVLNQSEEDAKN